MSVVFTLDSRNVITGSSDKTAKMFDITTGTCLFTFTGHTSTIRAVTVTPDGRRIVTGSNDKTAKLFDIASGACLATMVGHTDAICSVAITPNGAQVVTGSNDHTAKLFDISFCWTINLHRHSAPVVRGVTRALFWVSAVLPLPVDLAYVTMVFRGRLS